MSQSQDTAVPSNPSDQQRMYRELDKTMMFAHTEGENAKAIATARILISSDDVPLPTHARACMILASCKEDDFVFWAEEAMSVVEEILGNSGHEATDEERELVGRCKKFFDKAMEEKARLEDQLRASGREVPGVSGGERGEDGKAREMGEEKVEK